MSASTVPPLKVPLADKLPLVGAWPRLSARTRAWLLTGLVAIGVLAVFLALFTLVQYATPGLADNDGYYHMRMARLFREQGLKPDFVWLPLTILNQASFYDHHLLWHAYLALFAGSPNPADLIAGAKLASVIMPALAFLAIWWLLRGQRVRWAPLWALGLFALSQAFLYRLSMPRAQSASLLVLALGLHWLLTRRHWALLPLGFIYVWMYDAFPMLLVIAGVYVAAAWITERKLEWRALVYPAAGIGLGLVINLYFPQDLQFIFNHLTAKLGDSTPVGNEWYPYDTWVLLSNSGAALAAFLAGALALGARGKRMDRATLTAFGLAVVTGFMLFKARRFIEYFPAFALIFAALSIAPLLDEWLAGRPRLSRLAPVAMPILMLAVLAAPLALTVQQARAAMETSDPPNLYQAASNWVKQNSTPGSMIFQTDWDVFPHLFFYNTQNLYTAGLDPTYSEIYDPKLYAEWVKITRGGMPHPGHAIRADFGAEFVLTDLGHTSFIHAASGDPLLQQVYRDNQAIVYRVLP
jgi:hypothetical protein